MSNGGPVGNVIRRLVFGYECHGVDPVANDPPAKKFSCWVAGGIARHIESALKVADVLCPPRLQKLLNHAKFNGRALIFFLRQKVYKISKCEEETAVSLMIGSLRPHFRQILRLKDAFGR